MFDRVRSSHSIFVIDTAIGVAICGIVAALLSLAMAHAHSKAVLPLVFIPVLVMAAWRCGMLSAILGGVLAATIFSYFLFVPVGSFTVKRPEARQNLGWMLVVGIPAAYFAWSTKIDAQQDKIKPPSKEDR